MYNLLIYNKIHFCSLKAMFVNGRIPSKMSDF
jgi:hypothetical protein